MSTGWSHRRRYVVGAVALVLGVGLLPAVSSASIPGASGPPATPATVTTAPAARTQTTLAGFVTAPASVRVGGAVVDRVTVAPRAVRAVQVQYRRAGTAQRFAPAATFRTSARGVATLVLTPPAAGRWQFRALVSPTGSAGRFVTPTRTVVASGRASQTAIEGFDTGDVTIEPGEPLVDDVVIRPGARRMVEVQGRAPGDSGFRVLSTGVTSTGGSFRCVVDPARTGVWQVRLAVMGSRTATAATSGVRTVTVADRSGSGASGGFSPDLTAPGPVSGLAVSGVTHSSATLSWTNPAGADVTGAVVRRVRGDTPPATVTDGTFVADVPVPGAGTSDSGLAADTRYSYSVFAHDAAANYAPAVGITFRTRKAPDSSDNTPPGAITGLRPTAVTHDSVSLAWTNPDDADLTGAVIRRAEGKTAPATPSSGAAVADVVVPGAEATDTGLVPDTTYTYAVFAHDAVPNHAPATTVTVTTLTPPTTAVLSANPLGLSALLDNGKVTRGRPVEFDASWSFPAVGTSLEAATLDLGDGPPLAFGPLLPGHIDGWGTVHTYQSTGPRNVTLSVTDSAGTTSTAASTVTVFDPPTASLDVPSGPHATGEPLTLTLAATTPEGTRLTFYEVYVAGDETFFVTGDDAPPPNVPLALKPGTYTVTFIVENDAGGVSDAVEVPIEVVP